MKHLLTPLLFLTVIVSLTSCEVNNTTSGMPIQMEQDSADILVARKALKFINTGNGDSLEALFVKGALDGATPEDWQTVMTTWKAAMDCGSYPHDSLVSVSLQHHKTIFKETNIKQFNFPFINDQHPDSTYYFLITLSDNEVYNIAVTNGRKILN